MKYLLLFFLCSAAYADVVTCNDLACAQTAAKPKASLSGSDLVKWCDGAPLTGCSNIRVDPYRNMSSWTWMLTTNGWYTRDTIVDSVTPSVFTAKPTTCLPWPIGSGSKGLWEPQKAGDSKWSAPSIGVYACNDGYVYTRYAYAGNFSNVASELTEAFYLAIQGNTAPIYALSVSKITRPLTTSEVTLKAKLFADLNLPPLWKVKTNGTANNRNVYRLTNGVLGGTKIGAAEVGKPCDCKLKYQNTSSTYCGVSGLPNYGTANTLPADAVTICSK